MNWNEFNRWLKRNGILEIKTIKPEKKKTLLELFERLSSEASRA
jgi:hypothetical protein